MNPMGDEVVDAIAHRNQLTCDAAGLNAPFTTHGFPSDLARYPAMPAGRGEGALKRSAGLHHRPARRTVPSCTRRAGLVAPGNLALGPARAAQKHTLHIAESLPRLEQPLRYSITLRIEIALRAADTLSRETSKMGLRPVGRAAVATLETGLRPVRSAPTRHVVRDLPPRPARRPVSGCRRRASLVAPRNLALGLVAPAAQTHTPETVAASTALEPPHRQSPSLHLEIAFRSSDRSSRETSKTGLRPVGRAAVAAFETGLRPVGSARPHAQSPIRTPEPFLPILPRVCRAPAFPAGQPPPPARPSLHRTTEGTTWHNNSTPRPPRRMRAPSGASCDALPELEGLPNKPLHPTALRAAGERRVVGGCLCW
jgi:hypothetical protein